MTDIMGKFSDPSLVEVKKSGQRLIWHYKGTDLEGYRQFAEVVLNHGQSFFDVATKRPYGSHLESMNHSKACLLLAIYHLYRDGEDSLVYPTGFPKIDPKLARGFTTNYNYLSHFGLLTKKTRLGKVEYSITHQGRMFASGVGSCAKYAVCCQGDLLNRYGECKITDFIPNLDEVEHKWWVE